MVGRSPRILAITDRRNRGGRALADWLEELEAAGVDAVQVREKDLSDRELAREVAEARRAWRAPGLLLVNGRLDVALATGADGVHLPGDGVPAAALRKRFGAGVWIGCSTHRVVEVEAARDAGADYATFSPVFPTPSKMRYGRPPGLEGLRRAAGRGLPIVALGGIDAGRVADVAAAGAAGVAGIRVFHDPAALAELVAACREAWPEGS
jgi:thiamine-phosphate pyrophosphorylase